MSAYGTGFKIRMGILLLIMVGMGAGVLFDRAVVLPGNKKKIDEVYGLMDDEEIKLSAKGVRTEMVAETVGFSPEKFDDKEHNFLVETYNFGRGLPFLDGDTLRVVSRDGAVLKLILNAEYDPYSVDAVGKVYQPPEDQRVPISIGGVPNQPRGGGDDAKGDEKKEDDKGEEAKDGDKKAEGSGDKKAEGSGDKKEGDSKKED